MLTVGFCDDRYDGEADMDLGEVSHAAITPKDVERVIRAGLVEASLSTILNGTYGLNGHYKIQKVEGSP